MERQMRQTQTDKGITGIQTKRKYEIQSVMLPG